MTFTIPVWIFYGLAGLGFMAVGAGIGFLVGIFANDNIFYRMDDQQFKDWKRTETARRHAEMY